MAALHALLLTDVVDSTRLTEQLEEVSSMDTLLKIVQRGANNLLSVEEYLARVGVKGAGPS